MKVIAIILVGVLLTGCYQSLNQTDIKKAIKYCGTVENIEYVEAHMNGDEAVKCLNKDSTFLNRVAM